MKKSIITCLLSVAAMLPAALSAQPASRAAHHFYTAPPAPTCLGTETVNSTAVSNTTVVRVTDEPFRVMYSATDTNVVKDWYTRTVFLECDNSL